MERYFDAFLYVANWGTHELKLGLPAKLLSADTARLYCCGDAASVREKAGRLILTFRSEKRGAAIGFRRRAFCPHCCRSALSWIAVIFGACIWDGC